MADIVERLREKDEMWQKQCDGWQSSAAEHDLLSEWMNSNDIVRHTLEMEAATEIIRLRKQLSEAREACAKVAEKYAYPVVDLEGNHVGYGGPASSAAAAIRALHTEEKDK